MNSSKENFKYNGIPIFNVGSIDFSYFVTCYENGKRVLSKNILNSDLRDHYKKSRNNSFGICYEGVILNLKDLKKCGIEGKT